MVSKISKSGEHICPIQQDYKEAVQWYQKAADKGHSQALNNLGICYLSGNGVLQDYKGAAKCFQKGADRGNSTAQNNLGMCFEKKFLRRD